MKVRISSETSTKIGELFYNPEVGKRVYLMDAWRSRTFSEVDEILTTNELGFVTEFVSLDTKYKIEYL